MRFPRNARIFRGQLEVAPFAAVLFLLLVFVMLNGLLYTPGTLIELPAGDNSAGLDKPSVAVAIDANGRFYFDNLPVSEEELKARLGEAVANAPRPLMLIVQADQSVKYGVVSHVWRLARQAGFTEGLNATLPWAAPALPTQPAP